MVDLDSEIVIFFKSEVTNAIHGSNWFARLSYKRGMRGFNVSSSSNDKAENYALAFAAAAAAWQDSKWVLESTNCSARLILKFPSSPVTTSVM